MEQNNTKEEKIKPLQRERAREKCHVDRALCR